MIDLKRGPDLLSTYFQSRITLVGPDAPEMIVGGVTILFGEPCPDALAEVSIVHQVVHLETDWAPRPGDTLRVGASVVTFARVGELAGQNLRTLGHIVVYSDVAAGQNLLPGAIHALGRLAVPTVGDIIELTAAAA